jgi:hypothetical protein
MQYNTTLDGRHECLASTQGLKIADHFKGTVNPRTREISHMKKQSVRRANYPSIRQWRCDVGSVENLKRECWTEGKKASRCLGTQLDTNLKTLRIVECRWSAAQRPSLVTSKLCSNLVVAYAA